MHYIAGPLFKPEQIDTIREIEALLDERDEPYFSPREYGVIADEPMNKARMKRIYDMNIAMVRKCQCLIAILDDRDAGTIFEIGYAAAKNKKIITFSNQGHGVNVMLRHAIFTHTNNIEQLSLALMGHEIEDLEVTE